MTMILPKGVAVDWQYAINQNDYALWDELATDLLRHARAEPDHCIRDNILLLALVACERANDADPATAFCLDQVAA